MMDRATLLAHRTQWVTESDPSTARLDLLNADDEVALYRDLIVAALGIFEMALPGFGLMEQAFVSKAGGELPVAPAVPVGARHPRPAHRRARARVPGGTSFQARRLAGVRPGQVGSSAAARLSDSHRLKSAVPQLH